jgi:hypothetical protein
VTTARPSITSRFHGYEDPTQFASGANVSGMSADSPCVRDTRHQRAVPRTAYCRRPAGSTSMPIPSGADGKSQATPWPMPEAQASIGTIWRLCGHIARPRRGRRPRRCERIARRARRVARTPGAARSTGRRPQDRGERAPRYSLDSTSALTLVGGSRPPLASSCLFLLGDEQTCASASAPRRRRP